MRLRPNPRANRAAKDKDGPKIISEEKVEKAYKTTAKKGDYVFPPLSLLAPAQTRQSDSDEFPPGTRAATGQHARRIWRQGHPDGNSILGPSLRAMK